MGRRTWDQQGTSKGGAWDEQGTSMERAPTHQRAADRDIVTARLDLGHGAVTRPTLAHAVVDNIDAVIRDYRGVPPVLRLVIDRPRRALCRTMPREKMKER